MAIREEDQDRIERYVQGKLKEAEKVALEAECVNNLPLASALAEERDVQLLARATRMLELKDSMQAHSLTRRTRPQPRLLPLLSVLGGVAVVFFVVYLIWMRAPGYQRLALELAQKEAKSGNDVGDNALRNAVQLLVKDDPSKALPLLYNLSQDTSAVGHEALYFLGIAHALNQKPDSSQLYLMRYHFIPGGKYRVEADKLLDRF